MAHGLMNGLVVGVYDQNWAYLRGFCYDWRLSLIVTAISAANRFNFDENCQKLTIFIFAFERDWDPQRKQKDKVWLRKISEIPLWFCDFEWSKICIWRLKSEHIWNNKKTLNM